MNQLTEYRVIEYQVGTLFTISIHELFDRQAEVRYFGWKTSGNDRMINSRYTHRDLSTALKAVKKYLKRNGMRVTEGSTEIILGYRAYPNETAR